MVNYSVSSLKLVVLFLGISHVMFSLAVPTSRSWILSSAENSASDLKASEMMTEFNGEGKDVFDVNDLEGRIDMEIADYPPPGANPRHDPRTPGRG